MGMMTRPAVAGTANTTTSPPGPPTGVYLASVISYNATTTLITISASFVSGNFTVINYTLQNILAGQTVAVLGTGTPSDIACGVH